MSQGVVAVVIFPDNAWKYLSSFRKHLPAVPRPKAVAIYRASRSTRHLEAAFQFAKTGPDRVGVTEPRTARRRRHPGGRPQLARGRPGCDPDGPEAAAARVERREPGGPHPHHDKDTPLLTICAAGTRSLYALLLLKAQGYTDVRGVDGWHGLLGGRGPADLGARHPRWRRPARATFRSR